jgi:PAS domain-containing protein
MTLREEHGLMVYENRLLRRISGPKRDEVMGGGRILHNNELHDLYSLTSIVRMIKLGRMIWVGHNNGGEEEYV